MKRLPLFSVLCFALCVACESPPEKSEFPKDFRFGTAIAGFQTEMGCPSVPKAECEYASDWAEYVTRPELRAKPGLYLSGDPLSAGPGFFELYPQDIALAAQQLHNNSLRLSIEWGRVFPTATDGINDMDALKQAASKPALAFYHRVFSELKKQGIKPLVTLIHYALPTWLHDAYGCHVDLAGCKNRGWLDRARIVRESAKYAAFLGREFGGEVDDWATLNEPFTAVILAGYVFPTEQRTQPPAVVLEAEAARAVLLSEIEAHARMYDALKGADRMDAAGDQTPVRVGVVYNLQAVAPVDPENPLDVEGAKHFDYLLNRVFLNATIEGDLDEKLDGEKVHRQDLAHKMDFVGVNYYARNVIPGSAKALLPSLSPLTTFNFLTLETDFHYPRGLYEVLVSLKEKGLPLIVTETGVEDAQDSGKSAAWVSDSLSWVLRAISEGVRVEGYHYWTLMDNYEWNHGMRIKMGLYAVSPNDPQKKRIARKGVSVYSQIAQTRMLPQ